MNINAETLQDIINIHTGLFSPLKGFMDSKDYRSVVDEMKLASGEIWTIPITLDSADIVTDDVIFLKYNGKIVAKVDVEDVYKIKESDIVKIYKTNDINHPGVKKELARGKYRIGGEVTLLDEYLSVDALSPIETKKYFKKKEWKTIAGFQTRNIPHRAHEYLHRLALEFCDALFINPLVGWKKKGDFSEIAVETGYKALMENYYKGLNVYYKTLKTPMRYAGPREAIFHAIIRKNLGCTHFIIGRDHAGVGEYYEKYEAQELASKLQPYMDIKFLLFKEPFYCPKCEMIVSENICKHNNITKISGTELRKMLLKGVIPPKEYIRKEVAKAVIELNDNIFIKD